MPCKFPLCRLHLRRGNDHVQEHLAIGDLKFTKFLRRHLLDLVLQIGQVNFGERKSLRDVLRARCFVFLLHGASYHRLRDWRGWVEVIMDHLYQGSYRWIRVPRIHACALILEVLAIYVRVSHLCHDLYDWLRVREIVWQNQLDVQGLLSVWHFQGHFKFLSILRSFEERGLRVYLLKCLNLGILLSKLHGLQMLALLCTDWHSGRRSNLLLLIHFVNIIINSSIQIHN